MYGGMYSMVSVQRSEFNFQEMVLSLYHVGPGVELWSSGLTAGIFTSGTISGLSNRTFFTLAACMRTVFWIHDTESIAAKETTIELELMEFKAFKVLQRICRRKHRRRKSYMRISAKKSVSKMCKELFNFIIKTINQFKNGQKSWENLAAEIKIC